MRSDVLLNAGIPETHAGFLAFNSVVARLDEYEIHCADVDDLLELLHQCDRGVCGGCG